MKFLKKISLKFKFYDDKDYDDNESKKLMQYQCGFSIKGDTKVCEYIYDFDK